VMKPFEADAPAFELDRIVGLGIDHERFNLGGVAIYPGDRYQPQVRTSFWSDT
jgi:hypothetical protein